MSAQANGAELERVESFQWPSGHVGHLSKSQVEALEKFKELCTAKGYYRPYDEKTEKPPTHDEETLLRYLRARKFVPQDAFGQFKDTEDWRLANEIDKVYETIDVDEYESTRRLYPQWTGRRDKRGIPFYVFEVGKIDMKAVTAHANDKEEAKKAKAAIAAGETPKTPRKMMRLFALYENLCRFVLPLCSSLADRTHSETPISQSNNLVDISNVGLTKFWNLRSHMSDASELATAHYPETLDRIFIVGAPSFFPTVWRWIQSWFDPITVSKIFILSQAEVGPTLAKYIDMDNVPKKYGGNLDWQFGDRPYLDDELANSLQWKEPVNEKGHRTLPIGPIKLTYDNKGDMQLRAIGTVNSKPRDATIAQLHPADGVARLALSPGRVHSSTSPAGQQNSINGAFKTPAVQNNEKATMATSSDPDFDNGKSVSSAVPAESRAGTYTVPYTDDGAPPPPQEVRQGTSETRFEQQGHTHAEGQVASGTPLFKVDGQGEKHSTMDPHTVGQAPKEHKMPHDDMEPAQPGMMEKAQNAAGQAYTQAGALSASAMAAVGLGSGQKAEDEKAAAEKAAAEKEAHRDDPAVDQMDSGKLEEYLRHTTMSEQPKK